MQKPGITRILFGIAAFAGAGSAAAADALQVRGARAIATVPEQGVAATRWQWLSSCDRAAGGAWCGDPATWRFVLMRYLPALAAFNLLWELAQLPLYTLWTEALPAYIAYAVLHCTAGDVLIGAGALFAALIATRAGALREWRWTRVGVVAVAFGVTYTAFSEWMNTAIRASWAYSEWMPVLPFVPIGLSPLLQWVVVPAAALAFSRRLALPRPARRAVNRELGDRS